MSKILTITFSPAIDKSTSVPILIPEKKLNCSEPIYEPGGGGINIARAIKKLGGDAIAIYFSGGYSGKTFNKLLELEHINSVIIETTTSTRENLVVKETSSNKQYRFGMPAPAINEKELHTFLDILKKTHNVSYIVISGSLPKNISTNIFKEIGLIAKSKQAKLIVDSSGDTLKQAIKNDVYLIKPNLKELAMLLDKENLDYEDIEKGAKNIINTSKCEIILTSLGSQGAILVTKDTSLLFIPPHVATKSTVGAGDSMLAGIIFSLSNNKNIVEATQYGVACGTAATINPGTELCHLTDVEHLLNTIQIFTSINQHRF